MFLFTTNAPPSSPAPSSSSSNAAATPVVDAIRQGAQASGTSFDYLLATAQRESSLDPSAKAPTSSASGLYQFIEQTWLGLVKSEGSKLGLGEYSSAITARSDGSLTVADPGTRQAILKLREDPKLSATLAGTLAQKNGESLAGDIGRKPSAGDLYVAHVLGAKGGAQLINAAQSNPTRAAALDFPEAAAANRNIFYDRGRPRGAAEVYGLLAAGQSDPAVTVASAAGSSSAAQPSSADATALPRQDGPAFYGMFQTETRRGPVSDAVARIWRTNAAGSSNAGSSGAALSYFPHDNAAARSSDSKVPSAAAAPASAEPAAEIAASTQPAAPVPSNVPLPPPRPRLEALQSGANTGGNPLNLQAYMKWRRS